MTNPTEKKAYREFELEFVKRIRHWNVVIQPTTPTEDGYTTRVIERTALTEAEARVKELDETCKSIRLAVANYPRMVDEALSQRDAALALLRECAEGFHALTMRNDMPVTLEPYFKRMSEKLRAHLTGEGE
jgi:hypothetical protein